LKNIATQTDKTQTVQVIERLLKVDIGGFLYQQQIGSLYGRIFDPSKASSAFSNSPFLDFMPVFFAALAAIGIAFFLQKPLIAFRHGARDSHRLVFDVKQVSSQRGFGLPC